MNIEKIVGRLLLLDQIDSNEAITLLIRSIEGKECSGANFGSAEERCGECGECGESPCKDECTCECCYEYREVSNKCHCPECNESEPNNLVHDIGCYEMKFQIVKNSQIAIVLFVNT